MSKQGKPIIILYAEDDEEDRLLMQDALKESRLTNELHFVEDGEEMMEYLHRRGKYSKLNALSLPGLILLDLNLPKKDGREVLAEIKSDGDLKRIPVVILTTSKAEEDIIKTYDLHANCYVTKPVGFEQFVTVVKSIEKFWLNIVVLPPQ